MDVVSCTDNNYFKYTTIMLISILENSSDINQININILHTDLKVENLKLMKEILNKYTMKINFFKVDDTKFINFHTREHISRAAYLRIEIPNLFPQIEKILYLDGDIIVNGDVLELNEINIDNYYVAAVLDENIDFANDLGISLSSYFNSGFMLMNLSKWRETGFVDKIYEFISDETNKKNTCDQDAINNAVDGDVFLLPYEWNYLHCNHKEKLDISRVTPKVIHYASRYKPWQFQYEDPFKDEFLKYLMKTPWRNEQTGDETLLKQNKVCIFSASVGGENLLEKLRYKGIVVEAFLDNNQEKWGSYIQEIEIKSPEYLEAEENLVVMIGSHTYESEIKEQLNRMGYFGIIEDRTIYSKMKS